MVWRKPAGLEEEPFLFAVYTGVRADEVAAWGWGPAEQEAFLHMQFQFQQRAYALQFPDAEQSIIGVGDQMVGRLFLFRGAQELRVVEIALLPEFRGRGIGAMVLRGLQQEAAGEGKPLRLMVRKGNPAERLYRRLGFAVTGESDDDLAMEWRPAMAGRPDPQ